MEFCAFLTCTFKYGLMLSAPFFVTHALPTALAVTSVQLLVDFFIAQLWKMVWSLHGYLEE